MKQLVYPQWLHDLQQGKAVAAAPAGDWESGLKPPGERRKLYLLSHYPGAGYIDTNEGRANRCGIKCPTRS
ncbi:hypothetical protein LAD64_22470 [Klebsiella pneumoniae]|nr:hypothetical protein [Klebsiella pneumoniae]